MLSEQGANPDIEIIENVRFIFILGIRRFQAFVTLNTY